MSLPPLAQLTPNNNGPAAITVTYALIIVTILFCIIRVLTTFTLKRKFGWDDALLVVAVSIGLAQSIITEKSAVFGLGKHIDRLSAHQLDQYYKVRRDVVSKHMWHVPYERYSGTQNRAMPRYMVEVSPSIIQAVASGWGKCLLRSNARLR